MNDKFSAELRRHLLDTADERPAEGQLAAVVGAVAGTSQRPSILARLTWTPGRIGLVPTTAVRLGLVVAALALAMAAGAMLAGGPSGPTTVFEGTWTATDPADDSAMILVVGPGNTPPVYFEDGYATGDACVNDEIKRFTARGTGRISDGRLVVEFPDGGGCGTITVEVRGRYEYQASMDALVDLDGLMWLRALGGEPMATRAPGDPSDAPSSDETPAQPDETDPPATSAPPIAQGPKCFDVDAGDTYGQGVGDLSVTMTVPTDATFAWQGYRDAFELSEYCIFGRPVLITASMVGLAYGSCGHAAGSPPSAAIAVEWLTDSADYATSEPTALTLSGYAATRFEVWFESSTCGDEASFLWDGAGVDRDANVIVYIVDVEANGIPLGITIANRGGEGAAAQVAEAEAMVASMLIEP